MLNRNKLDQRLSHHLLPNLQMLEVAAKSMHGILQQWTAQGLITPFQSIDPQNCLQHIVLDLEL